ncbi:SusC/RagA family TonB-linked outer membrane protein [Sinomicrobium weinanense]|uniref:TonB-dependent receptor n=1 Tax=Sinomicrobium weinanense TaxID=2842200 RepID=A0A926Q306_9FLAO|nr:TonB-dependent receptor [Sinomicrobium weinanense]MBC9796389.1 TonB-dependent receptor [Sinomicrobium weinanense]MBU3122610.1 TonB-dependent receptor [Sinomicrobium weinanense]
MTKNYCFKPSGIIQFCLLLLCSSFVIVPTQAQDRTVRGQVTAADDGFPLPGVSIVVVGTTLGTTTDFDGNYEISVPDRAELKFSYIGYTAQTVPVDNREKIDISLEPETDQLSEVVVIGYGTQQKKVSTASTSMVKSEDIVNTVSSDVTQALQGQSAGVNITSTSGQPDSEMKVLVRGAGTIGDSSPLYVVDGVPVTDGIGYLDPSFIERIDVLKDASAAAIYGARAANGVVLVTTKKGKEGKPVIALNSYISFQDIYKKLDLLDAQGYAVIMNEATVNSGDAPFYSPEDIRAFGKGTDWQDEAVNSGAIRQNHSLSVSGGSEYSSYATSLSYLGHEGIIGSQFNQSNFERISFSANSEHQIVRDRLKVGENFTYTNTEKNGVSDEDIYNNSIRSFLNASPIFSPYDEAGEFGMSPWADESNPLGNLYYNNFNETKIDRIVGNIFAEITLLDGLSFRTDIGLDVRNEQTRSFVPEYYLSSGNNNSSSQVTQGSGRSRRWNWENVLRYHREFGKHNLDALVGTSAQKTTYEWSSSTGFNLTFNDFDHAYLSNATNVENIVSGGRNTDYAIQSYFGRVLYDYNNRYLFTATLRRDGSSRIGSDNRYGYFPSFSLGWNISDEAFFPKESFIASLKLRGGWGQNGNDRIGDNVYRSLISSTDKNYYFGIGNSLERYIGSVADAIANPDIKWETSEQVDIGFDARLLKYFTLTFDYYRKDTKDWLVYIPTPDIVGADGTFINGGNIRNEGFELELGYTQHFGDFTISASGNLARNGNKVLRIENDEGLIQGSTDVLFQGLDEMYRVEEGMPVGYFYGLKTDGIFQNEAEVAAQEAQPNARPGDVRFVDLNGDGVINAEDKTKIGDPNPDLTYGFNLNLNYRAFDLSVYTYGVAGNQNAFGVRTYERFYNNYTTDILNRWHGEGTSNRIPRVTSGGDANGNYTRFSDLYIQNASFFRIKTVNLGCDLTKLTDKLPFSQLRLYVSANNLFTFTSYKGMDPEIGFSGNTGDPWASGVDVGFYPQPRTYTIGLNLTF